MTSKQEKLAAARRKLKEFQGKNKEELLKPKNITDFANEPLPSASPTFDNGEELKHNQMTTCSTADHETTISNDNVPRRISLSSQSSSPKPWPDGAQQHSVKADSPNLGVESEHVQDEPRTLFRNFSDYANGLNLRKNSLESHDGKHNQKDIGSHSNVPRTTGSPPQLAERIDEQTRLKSIDAKDFFNSDVVNQSPLDDLIKPLQVELHNHAQTIAILVQQRNEAQTSLTQAQNLLAIKSGEVEELTQKISFLTSSINFLNKRLSDAEEVINTKNAEKEESVKKWSEAKSFAEKLQVQYNTKEEELMELKKRFEDKSSESQRLLFSLQEAQSQLSLSQIQIQQFSPEGHSGLAIQLSEIQNENLSLKQKVADLEKKLEAENTEKEQSSQKFHIYAQQCNAQLSSLNSELNAVKLEKDKLAQHNTMLSKNLSELESSEQKTLPTESFKEEIGDLHNQICALTEENNQLQSILKRKEEECVNFQTQFEEKDIELRNVAVLLKEAQAENKRLLAEAETPKANERLLATMESDKVAAAKAVAQNQKLKEQVVDLEKAFMKMSEEKLELTDQLAHEKHVNSELQNLLKKSEHHDHHDGHHDDHCHHDEPEPLVNDSNEIEELRNIVRQLQDDKIELKARLSSYELRKESSSAEQVDNEYGHRHRHHHHHHDHDHDHDHNHEREENESQCENTKLRLQQMEEKVRKTMNEIAILDEEKEKLEHLVLQLQGETETIGEYITLYQKQRMMLRQRAQEKDNQLEQLSKDKEELKLKLASLDELVQRLIAERESITLQPGMQLLSAPSEVPDNTAGKIRALINEIGSTTLINNHSVAFQHCPCCSGRLITI